MKKSKYQFNKRYLFSEIERSTISNENDATQQNDITHSDHPSGVIDKSTETNDAAPEALNSINSSDDTPKNRNITCFNPQVSNDKSIEASGATQMMSESGITVNETAKRKLAIIE